MISTELAKAKLQRLAERMSVLAYGTFFILKDENGAKYCMQHDIVIKWMLEWDDYTLSDKIQIMYRANQIWNFMNSALYQDWRKQI